MPDDKGQGIVRTDRGEEQPADKERAQKSSKTESGKEHRIIKERPKPAKMRP